MTGYHQYHLKKIKKSEFGILLHRQYLQLNAISVTFCVFFRDKLTLSGEKVTVLQISRHQRRLDVTYI